MTVGGSQAWKEFGLTSGFPEQYHHGGAMLDVSQNPAGGRGFPVSRILLEHRSNISVIIVLICQLH